MQIGQHLAKLWTILHWLVFWLSVYTVCPRKNAFQV